MSGAMLEVAEALAGASPGQLREDGRVVDRAGVAIGRVDVDRDGIWARDDRHGIRTGHERLCDAIAAVYDRTRASPEAAASYWKAMGMLRRSVEIAEEALRSPDVHTLSSIVKKAAALRSEANALIAQIFTEVRR